MEARFCPHCGSVLLANAKFCNHCGLGVTPPKPVQPIIQQPKFQQQTVQQPVYRQPVIQQPVIQQPVIQQPVIQQPVIQQPVFRQTVPAETRETIIPVEETPVEKTPVEEAPVEETPVEETPVEEAPVEEAPVEEKPQPRIYTLDSLPAAPKKEPEPAPAPAPKKASKWPKRGLLRGSIAVLLCLIIFALSFSALSWISLCNFVTSDSTAEVIEQTLRNLPIMRVKLPGRDGNIPFADWLDNQLDGTLNMSVRVDPEALQIFLRDSQTTGLLAQHLADYMNAMLAGDHATLLPETLSESLMHDRVLLGNVLCRELDEADVSYIVDRLVLSGILGSLNTDTIPARTFAAVRTALSWWTAASFLLLALVFLVLLAVLHRNVFRGLGDMGISFMLSGGLWGVLYLAWEAMILAMPWRLRPFVLLPEHYLAVGLIPCAIFFGTGVVLVILKAIAKSLLLRKENMN